MEELTQLVIRAQSGDADAYGEIVRRFQGMAYGYAYAFLGDFQRAEDVAQEAFVDAYLNLSKLREPAAFPGWFHRIVFKQCDRQTRGKHVAFTPLEDVANAPSPAPGPAESVAAGELRREVLKAVNSLPDNERIATTLYYVNGYSQKEIASFLEVPVTTIKGRLYTSRKRLRERMIDMVEDTFKSSALPDSFAQETMEKVVAQAGELNRQEKYTEAESLLRDALNTAPEHPGALKELNRAIMRGKVYGQHRWDLLPELAAQGRTVLNSRVEDEEVYFELAETLLAIPAMPQAIEFIEGWIDRKGLNLVRLGMLAWAKGCVGQYEAAEAIWNELVALAQESPADQVAQDMQRPCGALVDCFAAAGETDRAARVARTGWTVYKRLRLTVSKWGGDAQWPHLFKLAGLEDECLAIAHAWFDLVQSVPEQNRWSRFEALRARAWYDDMELLIADWLQWYGERMEAKEWTQGAAMDFALVSAGRLDELRHLAQKTWELLARISGGKVIQFRNLWRWVQYRAWLYIQAGDLDTAERVAREALAVEEPYAQWSLNEIAIARGTPTSPKVIREIEGKGVEAYDEYGMQGWYLIAREAAASGEEEKALAALRHAMGYWTNPPYAYVKYWEQDTRWGELRNHPEFKHIFEEKRQRIGPIYGELWYFPGW